MVVCVQNVNAKYYYCLHLLTVSSISFNHALNFRRKKNNEEGSKQKRWVTPKIQKKACHVGRVQNACLQRFFSLPCLVGFVVRFLLPSAPFSPSSIHTHSFRSSFFLYLLAFLDELLIINFLFLYKKNNSSSKAMPKSKRHTK